MRVYTVHEPPEPPADRLDRAERLAFIRDGFSWPASLFGAFWLISQQLWLGLLVYLAVTTLIVTGLLAVAAPQGAITLALGLVHLAMGFEASSLRRWTLERRGWTAITAVLGRSRDECERRFFDGWLPVQPMIRSDGDLRMVPSQPAGSPKAAPAPFEPRPRRHWWSRAREA